jgi:hypothetical protein
MSEEATAVNSETQDADDDQVIGGNVITLRKAKLIRLKKKMERLRKLKKEALEGYAEELKECKGAFNEANDLIGELNDAAGGPQHGQN